ncbi:MAG: NfeD family protein [Thermoanaerobaculales bacterium]
MTWGFAYLLIFLCGFMMALVSGFSRRLLHPSELCDHVVVPSHEHLRALRFPAADILASFLTLFGLASLLVHGFTSLAPQKEIAIGAGAGLVGIFLLRFWLCRICDPCDSLKAGPQKVKVVREIPANGYGQVEVTVEGAHIKLAARSETEHPIPVGALVEILDRSESVVVVKASSDQDRANVSTSPTTGQ